MALIKQNVPITLGQGIDTKTDEKLVVPGKLLELENGVFTRAGTINKRFGYNVLSNVTTTNTLLTKGSALGSFNNELNLYTGQKLFTYAESSEKWVDKGNIVSLVADTNKVIANSEEQLQPSVASNSGFTCYAYEVGNTVKYTVVDQATGTNIVHDLSLGADRSRPKVIPLGSNYLVILVFNSSTNIIEYFAISIADPATIVGQGTITGAINTTDPNFDAVSQGNFAFIAYNNSSNEVEAVRFNNGLSVDVIETLDAAADASECIGITLDNDSRIWVAARNGTNLKVTVASFTLSTILAPTVISSFATDPVNVTLSVIEDTATVFYEIPDSDPDEHYIKTQTITVGGTTGTAEVLVRGVGLAGKSFIQDGIIYIPTIHESPLQSTNFVLNQEGQVVARLSYQTAGVVGAKTLSEVSRIDENRLLFVSNVKGRLQSDAGNLFTKLGVQSTVLDFSNESRFQNTELANLYISGACPQMYDGIKVVEEGFNLYPEGVTAAEATVTGGAVANGTYQVIVVYEWTDNLGRVHRSTPSVPTSVTTTGSNNTIRVTVPTLRLTEKTGVRLVAYRTEDTAEIFYRAQAIADIPLNDKTTDTVTIDLLLADSSIIGNDQIYTTGGVLENGPAPASSLITTYKNRVILAGLEDKLQIAWSKSVIERNPPEFTDFFKLTIDQRGGDITAIEVMDNYLVMFKRDSIFVMVGEGPDELGNNNDFTDPQLITTDAGCDNPNSIVVTPVGLMFKSTKGIYLLDRGLKVSYIGAEVEKYNTRLITSSQLLSDVNQVRFTTNDNLCLVYDYYFQQWSTFTNHTAEDSIIFQDKFTFVRENGEVWQEYDGFLDNGISIKMKLLTSWFSFGDMQGFKRVYKMMFLGKYKGPHKLNVQVAQDFNPIFTQSTIIDVDDVFSQTTYGEDSPYGSGSPYGGNDIVYQFDVRTSNQKCQSIQFLIEDEPQGNGDSFEISNLAFEVGVKQGQFQLKNGNRIAGLSKG